MFPDFFDKIHKKKKIIISNEKNDKIIIYLDSKTLDFIEVIGNIARTRQYTKDGFDLSILTPM